MFATYKVQHYRGRSLTLQKQNYGLPDSVLSASKKRFDQPAIQLNLGNYFLELVLFTA